MEPFRYRLQVLLEQKQRDFEEAQRLLGERMAQVQTERDRMAKLQTEAEDARKRADAARLVRYQNTGEPISAAEMQSRSEHARWLEKEAGWAKDSVLEQRIAIEDAEDARDSARAALVEANRQLEVLKTHRARQEARFRKEQERLEAVATDDAGTVQFLRRNRE